MIKKGGIYKDKLSDNCLIVVMLDKLNKLFICVQVDKLEHLLNIPDTANICRSVDKVFFEYTVEKNVIFDIDTAPNDSFIMQTSDGQRWVETTKKFDVIERREQDLEELKVSLLKSLFYRLAWSVSPLPYHYQLALHFQKRLKSNKLAKSIKRGQEIARKNKVLLELVKNSSKGFEKLHLESGGELSKGNYEDILNYLDR